MEGTPYYKALHSVQLNFTSYSIFISYLKEMIATVTRLITLFNLIH